MSAGSGNDRVEGRFKPGNDVSKTLTVDGAMAGDFSCCSGIVYCPNLVLKGDEHF